MIWIRGAQTHNRCFRRLNSPLAYRKSAKGHGRQQLTVVPLAPGTGNGEQYRPPMTVSIPKTGQYGRDWDFSQC